MPLETAGKQIKETRKAAPFEKEFIRKDGTRVPVLIGIVGPPTPWRGCTLFRVGSHRAEADRTRPGPVDDRTVRDAGFGSGRQFLGWIWTECCTFINPAALQMLGYAAEECQGRNMHDLIHYKSAAGEPISRDACQVSNAVRKYVGMRRIMTWCGGRTALRSMWSTRRVRLW